MALALQVDSNAVGFGGVAGSGSNRFSCAYQVPAHQREEAEEGVVLYLAENP